MNKVLLVVAVILVGLRHSRVEILKNLLHDVVHFGNRDFLKPLFLNNANDSRHNIMELTVSDIHHHTGSGLRDSVHDFLSVKCFQCSVLLNDFHGE